MKIDKIAFPCSELFSPFWNIQSRVWKTKLGIHPVCFLYGDKRKCGMSEEYGEVVELKPDPTVPSVLQLQFSRFWYPHLEPETTWLIGDIDLIPLQKEYFLAGMESIPDDSYCHLNYSIIGREMGLNPKTYFEKGALKMGGYDLPGHYHCAKGKVLKQLFFADYEDYSTFLKKEIIDSGKYKDIREGDPPHMREQRGDHWMAEEHYTSEKVWDYFRPKNFQGMFVREYLAQFQRLEAKYQHAYNPNYYPPVWDGVRFRHDADRRCPNRLQDGMLVEIHCPLPYEPHEKALLQLLTEAKMYP